MLGCISGALPGRVRPDPLFSPSTPKTEAVALEGFEIAATPSTGVDPEQGMFDAPTFPKP